MASASSQEDESFTCPVCLELLRDPVAIPCGHNFCMRCIKGCWDQEDWKGKYSCPLCKQTFSARPALYKNLLIAEMVEKLRKTRIQAAAPACSYAGPGDMECDVCTGRKLKAVKSCLDCLMLYCDTHLKTHNELLGGKHTVINAIGQPQERICSRHKKVFEIFCRTDQSCICYLCLMGDHKGHDTVTAAAEWGNKKEGLGQSQRRCQQRIQLKEKELQELMKAVENLKSSAQTAVEESERTFTEICSIERMHSEVKGLIRAQEKAEVRRADRLLKRLEQEIAELKRRDAEMEQLSLSEDPIHFLKNIVSITDDPFSTVWTRRTFSQSFFDPVNGSLSALKMQLERTLDSIFKQEIAKISAAVTNAQIILDIKCTDPELPVRRADSMEHLPPTMSDGQALCTEPVMREDVLQCLRYERQNTALERRFNLLSDVTPVTKPISPPTNVEVTEVKTDSITLTWRNPSDQQCQFLLIEYKTKQETEWTPQPVQKNQESVTLSGLNLDTEYEIKATAMGKQGYAVSSEAVTAVTKAISPPTNVEVTEVKTDSITLTWRNPSGQQCQFLLIEYRTKHETEWTSHPVQKNQKSLTLSGLELDTEYEIKATAVSKQGCTVSSDAVTTVTKAISPPTNVKVKADSITLSWRNPSDQECRSRIEFRTEHETEWTSYPVQKNKESVTLSGLKLDTKYEIRATAMGKQGKVVTSDTVTAVTAKAFVGPPIDLKVTQVKARSITLTWSNPKECAALKQYIIEFQGGNSRGWQKKETKKEVYTITLENLKLSTAYSIRMRTEADVGMSEYGNVLLTETRKGPEDTSRFTLFSNNPERGVNPSPGNPPVYLLKMKSAKAGQFNKMVFGEASSSNPSNKTIMLVGATGSGKTTLINGMINYILGVEWKDDWRFKLIDEETRKSQAHSQTLEVTAYQIHHTDEFPDEVPYSLTIIDTLSFGDTRGIKQDKEITERIREFFTNKDGIDAIDAVCFVVQAALARLTHTQKYIFEAILSVFGKNIANNIITLVTFADGQRPPVLERIKEANIPCATVAGGSPIHFKFNNSVLFAKNTGGSSDEGDFDYMFWRMGKASMKKFFTHLGTMETQSLTLTKQVLQERKHLKTTIEGVQPLIQKGVSIKEEIRTTQALLNKHKTQIQENKDFEYEVVVEKAEKIDIPAGTFIMNCHGCNYTCHYPCSTPNDADKRGCSAMRDGYCTVCPGKCLWSVHFSMTYRWKIKCVTEKRTYQELKSKYEEAVGEKMNTEQILAQLEVEYYQAQARVVDMLTTVTKCLQCLKEIALRPDPLSTPDYIDLLIESEKQEARPGFKQRIRELQEVREGAILVQKVAEKVVLSEMMKSKAKAVINDFVSLFK